MTIKRDFGYDFVRFFAMMLILIHHLFTTFREQGYAVSPILKNIVARGSIGIGGVGVALFFILSGALLIKRYKDQFILSEFFYKRFMRIEIPQWIGFICAFALMYCLRPYIVNTDFLGIAISFLGLNYSAELWNHLNIRVVWVIGEWFTAVIIVCYALFPLLRKLFLEYRLIVTIFLSAIFLANLKFEILTYGHGWFSITNGLMCFWCGMLFEEYQSYITKNILKLDYLFLLAFIYFNPVTIFGFRYLACFVFSLALFIALYQIKHSNVITQYVCQYNYELYLVHHRIYILLLPALLNKTSNGMQLLIASIFVLFLTCLSAQALRKATDFTIEKIKNFKSIRCVEEH